MIEKDVKIPIDPRITNCIERSMDSGLNKIMFNDSKVRRITPEEAKNPQDKFEILREHSIRFAPIIEINGDDLVNIKSIDII